MTSRDTYQKWGSSRDERDKDCPSDDVLEAYRVANDSEQAEHPLAGHLQHCPSCINRLIDLREFAALEDAAPAPDSLLERVRASTRASLEQPSAEEPAADPSPGFMERVLAWITQPAIATGAFAALALTFGILLLQSPGPIIEPTLVPRGVTFDQAALRQALPAITRDGVYVHTGNQQYMLTQGHSSEPADETPPVRLEIAPLASIAVGDVVAVITPTEAALPARIERLGEARLETPDLQYEGILIGVAPLAAPPTSLVGGALLTPAAELIGVVVAEGDDGLVLAAPP